MPLIDFDEEELEESLIARRIADDLFEKRGFLSASLFMGGIGIFLAMISHYYILNWLWVWFNNGFASSNESLQFIGYCVAEVLWMTVTALGSYAIYNGNSMMREWKDDLVYARYLRFFSDPPIPVPDITVPEQILLTLCDIHIDKLERLCDILDGEKWTSVTNIEVKIHENTLFLSVVIPKKTIEKFADSALGRGIIIHWFDQTEPVTRQQLEQLYTAINQIQGYRLEYQEIIVVANAYTEDAEEYAQSDKAIFSRLWLHAGMHLLEKKQDRYRIVSYYSPYEPPLDELSDEEEPEIPSSLDYDSEKKQTLQRIQDYQALLDTFNSTKFSFSETQATLFNNYKTYLQDALHGEQEYLTAIEAKQRSLHRK